MSGKVAALVVQRKTPLLFRDLLLAMTRTART